MNPGDVRAAPGVGWSRAWAALLDEQLRGWLETAGGGGVALVALGSYARMEPCPASDVDLLLLHDGRPQRDLEELVRSICYPLWDAGLSVGHAVRTPKDAVRAAGERIDTATALIDRRLVAGEAGLLDDLAARTTRWLKRAGASLVLSLAKADAERHDRAGAQAGLLEPDLKDGAGGLRDLQSLRWAAACILGEPTLDALVGARYLGAPDHGDLAEANATLLAVRGALHLSGPRDRRPAPGGDTDRLRLDQQDEVARLLGWGDGDELLKRVGLAMRLVAHVHARTWPLLLQDARGGRRRKRTPPKEVAPGVLIADGMVELDAGVSVAGDPAVALRACAVAAAESTHFGRATTMRLRRELAGVDPLPWTAASREAFLDLLRRGSAALPVFADADHVGLLQALFPEWERVRGRPQRNPFHRFALDLHALHAVAELSRITRGDLDERHTRLWRELGDPDALLLAAFLHDVGKAWEGDHSEVGAEVVLRWLDHMGLEPERAAWVSRLVLLHLLLPDTATRRDLDDEQEIARVAELVADTDTLDGLYLLSLADGRATGPSAWSPWKDGLMADLHRRARRVLDGRSATADTPDSLLREARRRLGAEGDTLAQGELEALLNGLPRRYLRTADAPQLLAHTALLLPLPGPGELRARARPGTAEGTAVLSIVAGDRRGLIADCAGVLAGSGLTVLDARAFTRADGVALDWFIVRPGDAPWEQVIDDLRRAAAGHLDVAAFVARRERRRDVRPRQRPQEDEVEVRMEAGDTAERTLRIEVRGADAPGVLYRLARVIADQGLDLVGARVSTLGLEVRDVFFTRMGEKEPDRAMLAALLTDAAGWPVDVLPPAGRGRPHSDTDTAQP
jgi:[protein-PII] uridylyltransferase